MAIDIDSISIEIEASSEAAADNINKLTTALQGLKSSLSGGSGASQLKQLVASMKALGAYNQASKMQGTGNKPAVEPTSEPASADTSATASSTRRLAGAMEIAKSSASEFISVLKQLGSVASSVRKRLLQMAGGAIKNQFQRMTSTVKNLVGRLGGVISSFKRIAYYRLIRTVLREITQAFKDGTNNLYQWSKALDEAFSKKMDQGATNVLYLKNALGAALAPVLVSLINLLNAVIDKIIEAINWINQLFAKLSGASYWYKAKRVATEYADAAKGAGGAAKEALKYLAPFDELNLLPDEKSGGSGGGGTELDYSDMFGIEDLKDSFSFVEDIKNAIKNGDWFGAGQILADKLNEVISGLDVHAFGEKIGTFLNNAIQSAYGFMKNFDFRQLGTKIMEGLNGVLESIDFQAAGGLYVRFKTWFIDLIIGAIEGADWKLIGKSISDFLIGAFKEAESWVKKYDWYGLGFKLWQSLKNLFEGIDWASLASSFFTLLGTAFAAAVAGIAGFFTGVWEDLRAYFKKKTEEAGGDAWAGFKKGIKDALVGAYEWVKQNVVDPFVNAFKSLLGIASPSTVFAGFGKDIIEGLKNGIADTWHIITDFFSTAWENLKTWWSGLSLPSLNTSVNVTETTSGSSLKDTVKRNKRSGFATGGFPEDGLFFANHGELVGKFSNGKTAVANNEQIVAGISAGVEDANEGVITAIYSVAAQMVEAIRENGSGSDVDWNYVAKRVTKAQKNQARALGTV